MALSTVADARMFVGASMSPIQAKAFDVAKRAVVRVGDGRGFVVGADEYRYVITAAHCLPKHPEPHLANGPDELTYANLIGPVERKSRRFGPSFALTISSTMSRCFPSRTGKSFGTNARAMRSSRRRHS
jgi:hypothetical protein